MFFAKSNAYGNSNSYGNSNTYGNSNSYGNSNADADYNTKTCSDSATTPDAAAAPVGKLDSLMRELAKRFASSRRALKVERVVLERGQRWRLPCNTTSSLGRRHSFVTRHLGFVIPFASSCRRVIRLML